MVKSSKNLPFWYHNNLHDKKDVSYTIAEYSKSTTPIPLLFEKQWG